MPDCELNRNLSSQVEGSFPFQRYSRASWFHQQFAAPTRELLGAKHAFL